MRSPRSSPARRPLPPRTNRPQETAVDDTPVIVFSAPPREPYEVGREIYQPIVEYLSRVTGKRVVYRQPGNWLTYQTEMLKGGYDLVFDGPHFNSWRMAHQQHNALVRYADDHIFAVIVRKDNVHINDLKQAGGQEGVWPQSAQPRHTGGAGRVRQPRAPAGDP